MLGVIAIALFAALFFRLWALQVISGERYLQTAQNNQVRTFRVPAPRGAISDRNGEPLVSNRPGTRVQIWPAALEGMAPERRAALLERLSKILNVPVGEIRKELKAHRDDPLTPVTVREAVRDDKVRFLLEHQAQFPGVEISEVELRRYEKGNLGRAAPRLRVRDLRPTSSPSSRSRATRPATGSARSGSSPPTTATCAASPASAR